jgi:hypothetical protein
MNEIVGQRSLKRGRHMNQRPNSQARRIAEERGVDNAALPEPAELYKPDLLSGYLDPTELAEAFGVCTKTLDRWRVLGEGPPITKIGRKTYYSRIAVTAWLQAREQKPKARAA